MNYKGMNDDMTCEGFQYEVGKGGGHTGPLKCCPDDDDLRTGAGGFHACEYPLDVFSYYPPAGSRFFKVEQSGEMERSGTDSKVASTKIKIGAEIGIAGLVKASVEYTRERATEEPGGCATGDQGAASASGDQGAASATGYQGAASASGKSSVAVSTGINGKAMGAIGCAICLVERGEWDGETYPVISVKAAIVDGQSIKADTWYTLKNGEFVEVVE